MILLVIHGLEFCSPWRRCFYFWPVDYTKTPLVSLVCWSVACLAVCFVN